MPYRILHIADVHLDMAFTSSGAMLGDRRREQLRAAFERALALGKQRAVDAVCIAGDLYEDGRSGLDRAAYLTRVLGDLAPIRVFVSPGNHDPFLPASIYAQMSPMPSNVIVFPRRAFAPARLADGLTLWGCAHEHGIDRNPAIGPFACEGAGTHLLLFHGSDTERMPPDKESVAPFTGADVERTGAAHAMVGHFHGMVSAPRHAYPGSLEPHTFAQDGRHTASLVTVEDGRVAVEFVDIARVRYEDVPFDVTPFGDRAALADALRAQLESAGASDPEVFCRARLIGAAQPTLDLDPAMLEDDLRLRFSGITIVDESAAFDYAAIEREGRTVRARFVATMRAKIASASDDERPLLEKALRDGVLAFLGRTIPA